MKPFYYINNATIGEFTGEKFDYLERATEESLELAEANPGQSFEILKCVGQSLVSKALTFWMDGEEPPGDPRYRVLKNGDIFQQGDEFLVNGDWRVRDYGFGEIFRHATHVPHRRPL